MKAKIDKSGTLVGSTREFACPFSNGDSYCGSFCPLFTERQDPVYDKNTDTRTTTNYVEIYCGCQPVVFEIVEDERK